MRQSIVDGVNRILVTYCKGAVDKKSDKILAGAVSLFLPRTIQYLMLRKFLARSTVNSTSYYGRSTITYMCIIRPGMYILSHARALAAKSGNIPRAAYTENVYENILPLAVIFKLAYVARRDRP